MMLLKHGAVIGGAIAIFNADISNRLSPLHLQTKGTLLQPQPFNKGVDTLTSLIFKDSAKIIFRIITMLGHILDLYIITDMQHDIAYCLNYNLTGYQRLSRPINKD